MRKRRFFMRRQRLDIFQNPFHLIGHDKLSETFIDRQFIIDMTGWFWI
jgi:hypothetical protein